MLASLILLSLSVVRCFSSDWRVAWWRAQLVVRLMLCRKLGDTCLNEHLFANLRHARELIAAWRDDYKLNRPHTSLDASHRGSITNGQQKVKA
ncbi:transposase [Devosia sp. WQ 349]|nr:transposase [Devosia sp. WQ 349K1]